MSNQNRIERYADFEQMEYEPIIASAIDIYADEMSTSNAFNDVLDVRFKFRKGLIELSKLLQ